MQERNVEYWESLERRFTARTYQECLDELIQVIEQRGQTPEMPTGIAKLDDLIWGVHRKELLVVAARPSHGKTSLLLQMALNLAKKSIHSVFLSLEMSDISLHERLACNEFGINALEVKRGNPDAKIALKQALEKMKGRLAIYPLDIVDSWGFASNELEYICQKYGPRAIFVDHVQRVRTLGFKSKQEAIAEYIQHAKTFAMKYNCAMVVASQINRAGSGNESDYDFLKGSGEIEECADTIVQCKWEGRDEENPLRQNNYMTYVTKQRSGPLGEAEIEFHAPYYSFK